MSTTGSQIRGPAQVFERLFHLLVEIVHNGLKILSLELREEKIHFVQIFVTATVTVFLAVLTVVVMTFAVIYAIPVEHRLLGLLIVAGVFLIATVSLALLLMHKLRHHPFPFSHVTSEMTRRED